MKPIIGLALAALEADEQQQLVAGIGAAVIASDSIAPEPDSTNAIAAIDATSIRKSLWNPATAYSR